MNDSTVAFCIANYLTFRCYVGSDGIPVFVVENQNPVGFISPGAMSGVGGSLDEALKAYMNIALDQRALVKEYVTAYVAEPTANVAVLEAYTKDERVAAPVSTMEVLVEEPVVESFEVGIK